MGPGMTAPVVPVAVQPDRRAVFNFNAPGASNVELLLQGGPSPETVPMTKGADGVWAATLGPLAPTRHGADVDGEKAGRPALDWDRLVQHPAARPDPG